MDGLQTISATYVSVFGRIFLPNFIGRLIIVAVKKVYPRSFIRKLGKWASRAIKTCQIKLYYRLQLDSRLEL